MTADTEKILLAIATRRKRVCEAILGHPENFCVCEGCSSVIPLPLRKPELCLYCHAYRFDYARDRVLEMGHLLGAREFATTCPVVPRFLGQINQA